MNASRYRRTTGQIWTIQTHSCRENPVKSNQRLALVNDSTSEVVWAAELEHWGFQIRDALTKPHQLRRGRRNRKPQYCQPRFDNRKRPIGCLSPSLQSRVENRVTWVLRLQKLESISSDISQELVKLDTQLMENPDISRVSYQQGELAGYEVR